MNHHLNRSGLSNLFLKVGLVLGGMLMPLPLMEAERVNDAPFYMKEEGLEVEGKRRQESRKYFNPFGEWRKKEGELMKTVRPGMVTYGYGDGSLEGHVGYPLLNYRGDGSMRHFDFLGLISRDEFYLGEERTESKFVVFPLYFRRRGKDVSEDYSGLFPMIGRVRHYFGCEEIKWVLFPGYLSYVKNGVERRSVLWPFFKAQRGRGAGGKAFWPFYGHFWHKGEYDIRFMMWPFLYNRKEYKGDGEVKVAQGFFPFMTYEKSRKKEAKGFLWPFFGKMWLHEPEYKEIQFLWPLFVQGRGEGRYVKRWAPFYTESLIGGVHKSWVMWPCLKQMQWRKGDLKIKQQQLLYFLFWRQTQESVSNPKLGKAEKMHIWPFVSYWDNGAGIKQGQFLSPLEVFFQGNKVVRDVYSPLFALYRYSECPGFKRRVILYGLMTTEKTAVSQKMELGIFFGIKRDKEEGVLEWRILKGLIGYRSEGGKGRLTFFCGEKRKVRKAYE